MKATRSIVTVLLLAFIPLLGLANSSGQIQLLKSNSSLVAPKGESYTWFLNGQVIPVKHQKPSK